MLIQRQKPETNQQTLTVGIGGGNPPRSRFGNKDDSNGKDKGDPKDPMKFPDYYRRKEEDRFDVYIKYSAEKKKLFWWSHRSSNRQDPDSQRTRGGHVQLWGYYHPFCENIEIGAECKTLTRANRNEDDIILPTIGGDGEDLNCKTKLYGEAILEGSCKINRNLFDVINFKKNQGYVMVFHYNPDVNIGQRIDEYVTEKSSPKDNKKFTPCTDRFCYTAQADAMKMLGPNFVCDFVLSFNKLVKDNPGGMKMKFDYITTECPNPIEKCSTYMHPRFSELSPSNNLDKYPASINDMATDWISLNKGKGCDVLIHGDDILPDRTRGYFYDTDTKYYPEYEYNDGVFETYPIEELEKAIEYEKMQMDNLQKAPTRRERIEKSKLYGY